MTRHLGRRSALVALAATAVLTAGMLPAQAQSPAGKSGNVFTFTYYANAAHTGDPVGQWIYGYCPSYFTNSWGTRTAYQVESEQAC